MSDGPTLRIVDEDDDDPGGAVPAPVPPDDPEAWYAPDVRAQYESEPGVVATVRERDGGRFGYDVREPPLSGPTIARSTASATTSPGCDTGDRSRGSA